MAGQKVTRGLPKRYGKKKAKIQRYYSVVFPARKLRRLLRHNGHSAAKAWADAHGCLSLLSRLTT